MHKCADVYAAVVTLTGLVDADNTGHVWQTDPWKSYDRECSTALRSFHEPWRTDPWKSYDRECSTALGSFQAQVC